MIDISRRNNQEGEIDFDAANFEFSRQADDSSLGGKRVVRIGEKSNTIWTLGLCTRTVMYGIRYGYGTAPYRNVHLFRKSFYGP